MELGTTPNWQLPETLFDFQPSKWSHTHYHHAGEKSPFQLDADQIEVLLDLISATAITLDYTGKAELTGLTKWLPDLALGIEVLTSEAHRAVNDCNEVLHKIGGLPVRTSVEADTRIIGFAGFSGGVWRLKCKSPDKPGVFELSGSVERVREVYSATLSEHATNPDV